MNPMEQTSLTDRERYNENARMRAQRRLQERAEPYRMGERGGIRQQEVDLMNRVLDQAGGTVEVKEQIDGAWARGDTEDTLLRKIGRTEDADRARAARGRPIHPENRGPGEIQADQNAAMGSARMEGDLISDTVAKRVEPLTPVMHQPASGNPSDPALLQAAREGLVRREGRPEDHPAANPGDAARSRGGPRSATPTRDAPRSGGRQQPEQEPEA
jgi:hypothetical protein